MVSWGKSDNVTVERYETPDRPRCREELELEECPAQHRPSDPDMGADKAANASVAVPIPSDVARPAASPKAPS